MNDVQCHPDAWEGPGEVALAVVEEVEEEVKEEKVKEDSPKKK